MTTSDYINIFLGVITCIALFFSIKATLYTKDSLNHMITSRQMEELRYMHLTIHLQNSLQEWINDLTKISTLIKSEEKGAIENYRNKLIENGSGNTINEYLYNTMPEYLKFIYESGAQYYFDTKSLLYIPISDLTKAEAKEGVLNDFIFTINKLNALLGYIKNEIPDVFLETPASLNIKKFFNIFFYDYTHYLSLSH